MPTEYLIVELKKNPVEYRMIVDQAIADDEPETDDMLYLYLARYEWTNSVVAKWAEKWAFLVSFLYINR